MISRTCIFCGGAAGSAEHVFPNWLNKVFPRNAVGDTTVTLDSRLASGEAVRRSFHTTRPADLTIRKLCHTCNTGWMAALEGVTKPLIEPMLTGKEVLLDESELITVATWATKTAMTVEFAVDTDRNFTAIHRRFLCEHILPPVGTSVHAAGYQGGEGPFTYFFQKVLRSGNGNAICIHTLHVGTLVLQVCTYDPPFSSSQLFQAIPPDSEFDLPVYPPRSNWMWPRKGMQILDDALLDTYARRPWALGLSR